LRRPSALAVAAGAGAGFSIVVLAVPSIAVFPENARLRAALDAFEGAVGVVLAYVWWGRFREGRLIRDGALVFTFAVLGAVSLTLSVLPQAADHPVLLWTAATWRLLAAAALALAAVVKGHSGSRFAWVCGAVVLGLGVVVGIVGRGVDIGLRNLDVDEGVSLANVRGYPLLALVHGAGMLLYAIAAVSFVRSARRTNDGVLGCLSAGACLAAFARVHYVLFPSLYTSLVYSGDVLRFAAYLAFGAAAAREIRNYWGSVSAAAVAAERRRAARELHDGLVQELAFIRSRVADFALASPESLQLADLVASAERALAESRQLLVILTGQDEQFGRFDAHLRRAADEVARRLGVHVDVIAAVSPAVRADTAHALARVVREAVTNAAVHGQATTVSVEITEDRDHVVVTISDNGIGFDPTNVRPGGFGLTSIRERVAGLGGELSIESSPRAGTGLRVAIPRS
jgi:signal transduction histidine kinase